MLIQIAQFVQNSLPTQAAIGSLIAGYILRIVKTDKPLSISHLVADSLNQIAIIAKGVANFLDQIFPQNLK